MKQLVSILALLVATLYVGETNGDEPQASSPLNWGKQEWQKPRPTPPVNTPRRQFSAVSGGRSFFDYSGNNLYGNSNRRASNIVSGRYVIVYQYNQFGQRIYYYRPVYNTNVYIRNYNRSQQYNGRYFGNFLFGGWR
tara:strand:+ start:1353 stop:1763 length:411 start_codon:yes stop_codon:yes gene_type:complete